MTELADNLDSRIDSWILCKKKVAGKKSGKKKLLSETGTMGLHKFTIQTENLIAKVA